MGWRYSGKDPQVEPEDGGLERFPPRFQPGDWRKTPCSFGTMPDPAKVPHPQTVGTLTYSLIPLFPYLTIVSRSAARVIAV
ncbi:hypothetical protein FHU14_001555 [Mesorhizobium sp. RMAD-H1]|nr:hypothetical protein [Mesorhizobium sp. RMAD-H1]